MKKSTTIRTGRNCVFNLHIHLVFVTKYRRKVFNKTILHDLKKIFSDVCNDFESELIEFDGETDHVHLLVNYPPKKVAISKLVNSLKGVSYRLIKRDHGKYISKFLWKNNLWSPSYFAGSCGGAPVDLIRKYIEEQKTPD
ncbi:MAG: IS200/IS605 family transposase [Chlamydiae bacterium CG10_big_fil_rev_8_21_14_0_10_35_9]|nr:MAG: IS200/IS605 family transposase [Chlamydiae bacterium CG10_big_fil_rev_8_21_14_0_10_35_9]